MMKYTPRSFYSRKSSRDGCSTPTSASGSCGLSMRYFGAICAGPGKSKGSRIFWISRLGWDKLGKLPEKVRECEALLWISVVEVV